MTKQYTYKCRECLPRVRVMCIQEAQISPGAKRILERAFESHTDTEATWALLQANCLLLRRDQAIIDEPPSRQGGLLARMGKGEPAPTAPPTQPRPPAPSSPPPSWRPAQPVSPWPERVEREAPAEPAEPAERGGLLGRMQRRERSTEGEPPVIAPPLAADLERRRRERAQRQTAPPPASRQDDMSGMLERMWGDGESPSPAPAREPEAAITSPDEDSSQQRLSLLDRLRSKETTSTLSRPTTGELRSVAAAPLIQIRYPPVTRPSPGSYQMPGPKMLVVASTGHRILLPENGELVFGRLDPLAQIRPDVDLTFEDRPTRGMSRRHASINGWHGRYEITDLGSGNGTWVNGERIALQRTIILQVGDEIRLGSCVLYLDTLPENLIHPPEDGHPFLYVTFTGRYFPLPDKDVVTIGRADPVLGYTPDVDLSDEGDAAAVVSRHHAKLLRQGDQYLIEDLGSAFKTQVDGQPVYVGTRMPIRPGQHLWLGGCVLAFDVLA